MTGLDPHALLSREALIELSDEGAREVSTYSTEATLSDEPEAPAVEAVLVDRPVPSRAGLPLTEAVGRLLGRLDRAEARLRHLEVGIGIVAGVVLGLALGEGALGLVLLLLWRAS